MLSLITFLPLIGALVILALPKDNKATIRLTAVGSALASLAVSLLAWARFDGAAGGWDTMQLVERVAWIPAFNVQYIVGVDGLSLPLVLLTTGLSVIALIASFGIENRLKEYFFWFLLLETGMLGVFVSLDMFLFYVFWEITLVPMYFLIGVWGGPKREYAAVKFFLYTLAGSVLMLLGILALYFSSEPRTFDMVELAKQSSAFVGTRFIWVFLALFVGFAVKVPAFPFHTWLPLAHVEAPTAVSVILAGVLLKMGTYGLLRVSYSILPEATRWFAPYLLFIAFVNIVYGAFCAMNQRDMKRMVAYSSVNHMGYCLLGMAAITGTNAAAGLSGAMVQMVTHGIITGSLFLLVGVIYDQAHTRNIDEFGGLGARLPIFAGIMTVQAMASLGLPGLAGFVGEFLCFLGGFGQKDMLLWVGLSVIGIVVTAAFFLKLIKDVFLGTFNSKWEGKLSEMKGRELLTVVPLVVLTIWIGVYPTSLLNKMAPSIEKLIEHVVGK
ncbi:MAG: NADH-quinone oxidoreductase subunit M [Elusimicrobia bacterium]|nr:NADH-quinone oxidoreductase subunit M [Elusimicrobiota bacterium]MBP9698628.1 NADH-quinone oxidoreductase subunit M [Elusimicrobiota bacterium]